MTVPTNFVSTWTCPSPSELIAALRAREKPVRPYRSIAVVNEIRPIDLFCYLTARFGAANGVQNLLRQDQSDNLIHWDWTLSCRYGHIAFWGGNFRTDIWLLGDYPFDESDKDELLAQIRHDFAPHGKEMSEARNRLEHWTEFVNPYWRLKRAIDQLLTELQTIDLDPAIGKSVHSPLSFSGNQRAWLELAARYDKAFGLCFGVRSMLPVLAEAFVNLLIFLYARKDIRQDQRLYDNVLRQPIDIRIKSLHINCVAFEKPIDYTHHACRRYHSLVNERNDLLHGNVSPEKQRFNEVYFSGRVPVFKEYRSFWDRTVAVDSEAVGLSRVREEVQTVEEFTAYLASCLTQRNQQIIASVCRKRDLGRNHEDSRIGILFPDHLVDMSTPNEEHPTGLDRGQEA
jgi:hypothetical protein